MARPLRVLTINIWNRQGRWEDRLRLLQKGIADLDPDVIGVQEVIHRPNVDPLGIHCQARALADAWSAAGGPRKVEVSFGPAFTYESGDQFGNAVLSRFPLYDAQTFALPGSDARSLHFARVETSFGPLPFFVTHLSWKFDEGYLREGQVRGIADALPRVHAAGDLPAVLVGDLNAAPDTTEIRFLTGKHALDGRSVFFTDCFDRVGEGPGFTFDPPRNPHAALTFEAPRRIDYVLCQGPDDRGRGLPISARVVLCEVHRDEVGELAPSDHYGVLSELRMG
jgi:endonuclease/exonuclease/phosphatase family metal-dependent hydrolase